MPQILALVACAHSPLIAVVERDGHQVRPVGAITTAHFMERLIGGL